MCVVTKAHDILSEVSNVVSGGVMPMMDLITKAIAALFLVILLLFIDPKLSIIVAAVLGASYGLVYGLSRKFLNHIGKERLIANHDRYSAVSEAFGAVKEVKVGGLESVYLKRFSRPAKIFAHNQATARVVEQIPRFALEAIAFGGLLIVILYLMSGTGTFANSLPILSVYAFAGYRLLPALQQIYAALTQLRFVSPSLNALHNDLVNLKPIKNYTTIKKIEFKNSINLENIFYSYPNSEKLALENLSLKIPIKSTIGLVGETGSGKTTTVDLILGLLEAQKGKLRVDSEIIDNENLRSWQNCIGYVPQQIFLVDNTIESNIAFGVDQANIDQKALVEAAKISNIHNFIKDELPLGYKTFVGEKGIRLSGGQRQRIGIARALYHRPKVLIFDEATSALDNITEKIIMESVYNLKNKVTIILIAHRLSTINLCQKIFLIEKGKIRSEGNYQELIRKDLRFREMARE